MAWTMTCSPALSAPEVHSYRSSGVLTNRPVSLGASVNGCEHRRRVRAERAVDEALEAADVEPRVAAAARRDGVAELLPRGERNDGVDARLHPAGSLARARRPRGRAKVPMLCTDVTPLPAT